MMWQVVPLDDKKGNKICGFSQDEQGLLVVTQDGRFFQIGFNEEDEITGCDLITAGTLSEEALCGGNASV